MKSNTELYEDILEKLNVTPNLDPKHITIGIDKGVVTLNGTVGSLYEKIVAERAVKTIAGVKAIANDLVVNLNAPQAIFDTDIAKAAIDALNWHVEVPANMIQVTVKDGHVKLNGEVEWWYQRRAAEKTVRRLRGVKSLINEVSLKPRVTEKDVKKQILREFHRHAQIDAEKIQVELDKRKVILKGSVRNFAEMKEAEHAAWSIAGVTEVDNLLHIQ